MNENTKKTATSHTWADLEVDHPAELVARQRIVGERMMVSRFGLEPGFHMDPHTHHNEQISIVLEGRLRFAIGEPGSPGYREEEVNGGQVMVIPPFVPHGATALECTTVLDFFSPPSEKTGIDEQEPER
jgi:quercetin dioxygenase-like cupin family protein